MMDEGKIDIFTITDRLKRMEEEQLCFIDFCTQRASVRKYGKKADTQERYDRFLRLFIQRYNATLVFCIFILR